MLSKTPIISSLPHSRKLIGRNDFLALGYVPKEAQKLKKDKLVKLLEPAASNEFIRSLVINQAALDPAMSVHFKEKLN